jgi:ribosomal protein L37E
MEQCTICDDYTTGGVKFTQAQIDAAFDAGFRRKREHDYFADYRPYWYVCPSCLKKVNSTLRRGGGRDSRTASQDDGAFDRLNHLAAQSQKALDYLDKCNEWTFEEFVKVNRLAETNSTESELRTVWDNAVVNIAPLGGQPGGKEYLRVTTRNTLAKAIKTFVSMGAELPSPQETCKRCGKANLVTSDWTCPHCGYTQWSMIIRLGSFSLAVLAGAFLGYLKIDNSIGRNIFGLGGGILGGMCLLAAINSGITGLKGRKHRAVCAMDDVHH